MNEFVTVSESRTVTAHGIFNNNGNLISKEVFEKIVETNLGYRMAMIFKNVGLSEYTGSLHIFRRTFATKMYEDGARVEDIAAYIGDLVSTTEKYYIAVRKKVKLGEKTKHIVEVPKKQIMDNKAV